MESRSSQTPSSKNESPPQRMSIMDSAQKNGGRVYHKSLIRPNQRELQQLAHKRIQPQIYYDYAELAVYIISNIMVFGLIITALLAFFSDLLSKHQAEI